ncbi:MAG: GTP-binding protein [Collinsella sp.]
MFADNDRKADELRARLRERGTFLLNLMSSPGSGKTTTLRRTVEVLRGEMAIAVMEADIDSDVDARTMAETGVRAIQLHTGGMCHLDAYMTEQGLEGLLTGAAASRSTWRSWRTWATWCAPRSSTRALRQRDDPVGARGRR